MIGITSRSSADYYLSAACGRGQEHHGNRGPADYEMDAVAHGEPPGVWVSRGPDPLGMTGEVDPDEFRMIVNELRDPRNSTISWVTGEKVYAPLGKRPTGVGSAAEREKRVRKNNPEALPEELLKLYADAAEKARASVHAYDVTFSLPKSWSVLHAALQSAGRHAEANLVWQAAQEGVEAALDVILRDHALTREGVSGPKVDGRTTQRRVRAKHLMAAMFRHHTSRDGDPQLHAHVALPNRVLCDDGAWRSLDATALYKNKHGLDATFMRVGETALTRLLNVHFATTPDGTSREIVGVSPEVRAKFSTRVRALKAKTEEVLQAFEETYGKGVQPSPRVLWRMNEKATLDSRKKKDQNPPSRDELLDQWQREIVAETKESFASVLAGVDAARAQPVDLPVFDPQLVIEQALAHLDKKATWRRSHLKFAISNRLPDHLSAASAAEVDELLEELTEAALNGPGVVALEPPLMAPVPPELIDPRTGRSVYDNLNGPAYATTGQLQREGSLIARLSHRGGRRVARQDVAKVLEPYGLGEEQAAAASTILTSDRRVHLVNAGAGVGKSRLVGALADAHEKQWGQPLVGFTTAQNAVNVMKAEGVGTAFNIARFLSFHERLQQGEVTEAERAEFQVAPGSTVVIDEASTVSAAHFQRLADVLDEAGAGKIVIVGDTEQVDAVDQAGTFALLAEHGEPLPIDRVRRFVNAWEREASASIREGDVQAVHAYDTRDRVHGGDLESVRAELTDRLVTDLLDDRDALAITSTSAEAATISSMVREALVRAGRVDEAGVDLHDKTTAGVGDVVQARQNDWTLPDGPVVNRETYRVVGTTDGGALLVQRQEETRDEHGQRTWAPPRELPAAYVARFVELAYAGTVHAVQGRTVDAGHALVDDLTGRSGAYPGLTRGRAENHAYVPLERNPELTRYPNPNPLAPEFTQTAAEKLALIVSTDDHERSAKATLAAEMDRAENLGHLGPQWQAMTVEGHSAAHTSLIRDVLGTDAGRVLDDDAGHGVLRVLRAAEVGGHDARTVLAEALQQGSLETAHSPGAVLHNRLEEHLAVRAPERDTAKSYQGRAPQGDDHMSVYARFIAEQMDRRTTELGMRTADEAPGWATSRLGPVPDRETDSAGFFAWVGAAAPAAGFREQFGYDDQQAAIGPGPSHAEPEKLWVWNRAADGLGFDPTERDLMTASRGELANRVQAWEREQQWMPPSVDDRLKVAHGARDEARRQEVDARANGQDDTVARAVAAQQQAHVDRVEEIAAARAQAVAETRETRDAARAAGREIKAREEREQPDTRGDVPAEDRAGVWQDKPDPEPAREEPTRAPEPEPARTDHDRTLADLDTARNAVAIMKGRAEGREQGGPSRSVPVASRDEAVER